MRARSNVFFSPMPVTGLSLLYRHIRREKGDKDGRSASAYLRPFAKPCFIGVCKRELPRRRGDCEKPGNRRRRRRYFLAVPVKSSYTASDPITSVSMISTATADVCTCLFKQTSERHVHVTWRSSWSLIACGDVTNTPFRPLESALMNKRAV